MKYTCKKCGREYMLIRGAFCPECGGELEKKGEDRLECKACGARAEKGQKFCTICGGDLKKAGMLLLKISEDIAERKGEEWNALGDKYFFGREVESDRAKAFECYQKGALLGNATAYYNLALCYDFGYGVEIDKESAARYYRVAAEKGEKNAMFNLALCYEQGEGVKKDVQKRTTWLQLADKNGQKDASLALCQEDKSLFEKLADKLRKSGNPAALYNFGLEQEKSGDFEKAFESYSQAAEKGLKEARFALALCYLNGTGTPQNLSEAEALLKELKDEGMAEACYYLGKCYEGEGKKKEAFELYQEAGKKGFPLGWYEAGLCYKTGGRGVTQNRGKARNMFEMAREGFRNAPAETEEERGEQEENYRALTLILAQEYRECNDTEAFRKAYELYREVGEECEELAVECFLNGYKEEINGKKGKFARCDCEEGSPYRPFSGNGNQLYRIGIAFYVGKTDCNPIEKDDERARFFLERAADCDHVGAHTLLGSIYLKMDSLQKEAFNKFDVAINLAKGKDCAEAYYGRGYCYENGIGVYPDYHQAFSDYQKAAEEGILNAIFSLAYCYEHAIGTKRDMDGAKCWYLSLAKKGNALGCYHYGRFSEYGLGGRHPDLEKAKESYRKAWEKGYAPARDALVRLGEIAE